MDIKNLKLTVSSAIGALIFVSSLVTYAHVTFVTKNEVEKVEKSAKESMSEIKAKLDALTQTTQNIREDVSFIKGQMN